MKKYLRLLVWLVMGILTTQLLWFSSSSAVARDAKHYTELTYSPLSEINIPDYERYQLDNGMVVYLLEDHQLPLISGQAIIKTGSRLETNEQVGLAELMGRVWRVGGTEQHSPGEINDILEQKAARIESSVGLTSANMGFDALSEDTDTIIPLFAEIMRYPKFAAEQVEVAKTQLRGSIARRNDNPEEIASRELDKLIYGEQSPYARTIEYSTLEPLTRTDIQQLYEQYVSPEQVILGIVGDFDTEAMKKLIAANFGDWQVSRPLPKISIPEVKQKYLGGVFTVNQPQLSQSNVLLGHLGVTLDNPDYPALTVLNSILNGQGGRLFKEVRSRQGLAYSVYGVWQANYDYPGLFVAGGQTRSDATVDFISSIIGELEQIQTTPVTAKELDYGKNSLLNSFVFKFAQPIQTLSRLMTYEYYDYPEDFIFQYLEKVKATTTEDITRVAQTYYRPEDLVILVVGNQEVIEPSLRSLNNQIQVLDITIPDPAQG